MSQPTSAPEPVRDTSRRAGRGPFILITLLFLLPVVAATALYVSGWRPHGKSLQYGELLQPAKPLADVVLNQTDGSELRLSSLRGTWTFITVSRLPCNESCRQNLYKIQQVRLTQGKDATRVNRVLIAPSGSPGLSALQKEYPGLLGLSASPASLKTLLGELLDPPRAALEDHTGVYLVDPLGNLVMRYAPEADPSGMRKDLARLLHLSQIG